MTDKQKIQMLAIALIWNTTMLNAIIALQQRDSRFMRKRINQQWDAIEVLMETADINDERFQQFGFDVKFELMQHNELKSLKHKGWWRK